MIDCAEVSNSVSNTPSRKATTYRTGIVATSATTATVMPASNPARTRSTSSIVRRRSSRSARAPATRANSSHGSREANATPAMSAGESVSWSASSGSAIQNTPSARFEAAEAAHSFQ